jgi:hypothetical protein
VFVCVCLCVCCVCNFVCAIKHASGCVYLIFLDHGVSFNLTRSLFFSSVFLLDDVRENECTLPWPRAYINAAALTSMVLH